jgi:hypothetical protein
MKDLTIRYWSPHGRQEETKFQRNDTKIDLAMRAAKRVDLSDIQKCTGLEKLDLSFNMLDDLDLSPLASSSLLQEIQVQNNHLTNIDLWPLANCANLKEIDISDNRIRGLDLTPVFLMATVRMDSSAVISADSILHYVFTREQLCDKFKLIRSDKAPWTAPPVIMWVPYRELERKYDWPEIRQRIASLLDKIPKEKWFAAQRGLLSGFGMDELAGFDGNPANLLEDARNDISYRDARQAIFDTTINAIESQIERGGPTLFLDTERMSKTRASKLIPLIVERRQSEIENASITTRGRKVLLEDLWLTHYGYQILKALKLGLITDNEKLSLITEGFEELGMTTRIVKAGETSRSVTSFISESMRSYVMQLVQGAFD